MKNKFIIIAIILLLLLVNPKTIRIFSESIRKDSIEVDIMKSIDIDRNIEYTEHDNNLVYYNEDYLKSINIKLEEIFKIKFNSNKINLESNRFLDVLDKENNIIYSIDDKGSVVSKKKVHKDGIMYKSIDNESYLYTYKKDDKNITNIYNNELNLVKSITLEGLATDIDYSKDYIYITTINIDNKMNSMIYRYDYNGNLKGEKQIENSILLDCILKDENIYLIEKNKVSIVDKDMKIKNEFKVNDIKSYSNLLKDSIYILEENGSVKLINDSKIEDIKFKEDNLDGTVNIHNGVIGYVDNKIINKKGIELRKFEEDIKNIEIIKEDMFVVELENSIKIIKIK